MTALTLEWRVLDRCETGFVPQPRGDGLTAAVIGPPGRDAPQPYEHVQAVAAVRWVVNHNRGRWPASVTILTMGGVEVEATVTHVSPSQITIDFVVPFSGTARLI